MCSDTSTTSPAAAMSSQTRSPHPSIPGRDRRSTAAATAVTNASGTWVMVAYLLYSLFRHSSPPALPVPAPHRVEVVAVVGHEAAALHRSLFLLFLLLFRRPGDGVFAQSLRKFFPCRVKPAIHGPTIDMSCTTFANVPVRAVPAANARMARLAC